MAIIGDQAIRTIEAFGGPSKLARALDAPVSTVLSWSAKKRIPRWWRTAIETAAEREGVDLPAAEDVAA
ncbi:MAG: carph-isopro domain-containing protein [Alphaproteobacteria bacterium]